MRPVLCKQGFNRNIVECKETWKRTDTGMRCGFNRNIVECKGTWQRSRLPLSCVLIETLWNVKEERKVLLAGKERGFNRNIVECKVGLIGAVGIGITAF